MNHTFSPNGPSRRHISYDEADRFSRLLDASRRRAAELEIRRRNLDGNCAEIVHETLDELWCALDILNDAVSTIERIG